MYEYRDPSGRARLAIGAIVLGMIANIIFAIGEYMSARAIEQYQKAAANISALERVDTIGMYTGIGGVISIVVTSMVAAFWINRVNKNAWVVDRGDMTITPGWNVGYFFVPFANLLLPFRGLRETLQVSTDPYDAPIIGVPILTRLWWACWLIGGALNNISLRMALKAETLDDFRQASWFNVYLSLFELIGAWLFIWVIRDITRRQVENIPRCLADGVGAG